MAEYLTMKPMTQQAKAAQHPLKLWLTILFSMAIILAIHTAQADILKDPTQPPASLNSNDGMGQETVTGPVLQSVMIGPHYRAAIINGQKVLLGKKYEQATLIKLNEHEAVLRNPDMTTQTLVMDFAIDKKMVLTDTPVAKRSTKKIKVKRSFATE